MKYRQLGSSSLNISVIGFGGWAMGKASWGEDVVDDDSIAAIKHALELDINFYDTAQAYGPGHSEKILGRALSGYPREKVIIATKTGLDWDDTGRIFRNSTPEYIHKSLGDSLERIQTDYIDLYQVHWPDENVPIADTAAAMKELLDAGKIKAAGVSNYSVAQMEQFMAVCPLHSLQPPFSMIRRQIESEILPFCCKHNIGVLAYSPMARGLLTGKYDETATFPPSDARSQAGEWKGERLAHNVAAVRELTKIAEANGKTMAQLALAWVLNQPGLTCALAGTKRPYQIEESCGAAGWVLDAATLAQIEEILQRNQAG
jgi:aryl-alcohol dehydrogenase-like predicted oxidoreductase